MNNLLSQRTNLTNPDDQQQLSGDLSNQAESTFEANNKATGSESLDQAGLRKSMNLGSKKQSITSAATQSVNISKGKPLNLAGSLNKSGLSSFGVQAVGGGGVQQEGDDPVIHTSYDFKLEELSAGQSRWVIPANKTLLLVVRFSTKKAGCFEGKLEFENIGGAKKYTIDVVGDADYPSISTLTKNLYWQFKKTRPTLAPDSYLSKVFVVQENTFEFGPLLVGKNPDKRGVDNELKKVNSSTFRISNNGKFPVHIDFALLSTVKDNDPVYRKGVFSIEPESMQIAPQEVSQELRIWAIPSLGKRDHTAVSY